MRSWNVPLLVLGIAAGAYAAEDDLSVVKRAVESPAAPQASPSGARWLKVRVTEKGSKKARVSLNLPLGLAKAFSDLPLDLGCRKARESCKVSLGQLLSSLKPGQELVDVEDEEATVRVWIE